MLKIPRGCTAYTRKCMFFDWNLGESTQENRLKAMPPCCTKHLREILWYLSDLFEEQGIFYWLDFGTLLGAVRGGRSIPHDTDGDMCLFMEDKEKVLTLAPRIWRDGFTLNFIKPAHDEMLLKVTRSKKNFMMVDLFFWEHDYFSGIYWGTGLNVPKRFPDWWLQKRDKILMFDKEMWSPREPEKFLRMRFGKDWRIPQDKKVHHYDAELAHKFGFEYAAANGWKKANKIW